MKITKNQLRKIVKEELMREGFFDSLSDLGKKAMSGLGKMRYCVRFWLVGWW